MKILVVQFHDLRNIHQMSFWKNKLLYFSRRKEISKDKNGNWTVTDYTTFKDKLNNPLWCLFPHVAPNNPVRCNLSLNGKSRWICISMSFSLRTNLIMKNVLNPADTPTTLLQSEKNNTTSMGCKLVGWDKPLCEKRMYNLEKLRYFLYQNKSKHIRCRYS